MKRQDEVSASEPRAAWRFALPALIVVLLSILTLYRDTAWSMVDIWSRSETFTHGFLVPPIVLWLVWRLRDQLACLAPRPSLIAILAFFGVGFVWLLGEIAAASVVSQFAMTGLLVLAVPALLGLPVARRIMFPLGFLFFAVPFGEFAMPRLMEWTAHFTVLGLRLSGVPVFREGLNFVIPSGQWSVVEACSGVRYLIASLTVGTLFAYLNYRSLKRRLIFIGVAFFVPVVANWLRAYMIVMLGHLSGNKLATGVDHLIYGWLFFGLVIMIMFWIGARWREDDLIEPQIASVPLDESGVPATSAPDAVSVPVLLAGLTVMIMAVAWPLAQWQIDRHARPDLTELGEMQVIPGWPVASAPFVDWRPAFENASAIVDNTFANGGRNASLYIAYYRNQGEDRKMVTTTNSLVRGGSGWHKVAEDRHALSFLDHSLTARRSELRSTTGASRLLVWQWYWVNGYLTESELKAKALTAFMRLLGEGDDSAVIIVYAPKDETGAPDAALEAFVQAAAPAIDGLLRHAQEKR